VTRHCLIVVGRPPFTCTDTLNNGQTHWWQSGYVFTTHGIDSLELGVQLASEPERPASNAGDAVEAVFVGPPDTRVRGNMPVTSPATPFHRLFAREFYMFQGAGSLNRE
jgi:hypothetical protein